MDVRCFIIHTAKCLIFNAKKETNKLHGAKSLKSQELVRYTRYSQHFMKPEGSMSCSKEPATGLCPQPHES
jgi:hypothetical protein